MGQITEFLNRHNLKLYKCERCGIIEAPFLRGESIGDYGWYVSGGRYYCHKCIRHPESVDKGCVRRHNKFVKSKIINSRYAWLFRNADFSC